MKTVISNLKLAAIASMIFFSMGIAKVSYATDSVSTPPMPIQYVGKQQTYPVFQLKLNNKDEDEFLVTIRDVDQVVLYSETLKGKNVSRKYGFDVEASDLTNLRVVITSKKTKESQVYKIVSDVYSLDDVAVAKL
jgi:hypothetical protein